MGNDKESSIIPAETVGEFNRWSPPDVLGTAVNAGSIDKRNHPSSSAVNTSVTAQNAEAIRKAAYQEGLNKGIADGKAQFQQQQQLVSDKLSAVMGSCEQLVNSFEEQISEQLVKLTIGIAQQIIRHELNTNPEQITQIVAEALNCLPTNTEKLTLKLHPDDAQIIREIYSLNKTSENSWTILEDPLMQSGGCMITTDTSVVNADLDQRIKEISAKLLTGSKDEEDGGTNNG